MPQLPNRRVQPVIEVDEGVGWPQALTHGLACDHFARPLEEQYQELKRLVLQPELDPGPAELTAFEVELERAELFPVQVW